MANIKRNKVCIHTAIRKEKTRIVLTLPGKIFKETTVSFIRLFYVYSLNHLDTSHISRSPNVTGSGLNACIILGFSFRFSTLPQPLALHAGCHTIKDNTTISVMPADYTREGTREKGLKALGMNCKCLITGFVKMFEHEIQLFFQTQVKVVSVKKVPSCGLCGALIERVCTQIKTSPISL